MTDKRAFEAKLDAYGDACYRREHSASARAAVLAAYDAARVRDADPNEPDDPPLPEFAAAGREGQPVACIVDDGQERELCWWDEGYSGDVTKLYAHPAPKADEAAEYAKRRVAEVARTGEYDALKELERKEDAAADWVCVLRHWIAMADGAYRFDKDNLNDLSEDLNTLLAASPARAGEGEKVTIPVEPTPGLLMSMAMRYDHAFGMPGFYDQQRFGGSLDRGLTHARRLAAAISQMRQIHEEVVGTGFYKPEREAEYAAMSREAQG